MKASPRIHVRDYWTNLLCDNYAIYELFPQTRPRSLHDFIILSLNNFCSEHASEQAACRDWLNNQLFFRCFHITIHKQHKLMLLFVTITSTSLLLLFLNKLTGKMAKSPKLFQDRLANKPQQLVQASSLRSAPRCAPTFLLQINGCVAVKQAVGHHNGVHYF